MDDTNLSRRAMLRLVVLGGAVTAGAGTLLAACGGGPNCESTSGLSGAELTTRVQAEYVESSPDAAKKCSNCNFFIGAPTPTACGTCRSIKGPINPNGHCKLWAAKPA